MFDGKGPGPPGRATSHPVESTTYQVEVPDLAYYRRQVLCQQACPVGTDAGRYVSLLADGKFEEAYAVARRPNPLASICGRICAHPCEASCRRGKLDEPLSIRALKRVLTEMHGPESLSGFDLRSVIDVPAPKAVRPGKIAIVGAGPAGLACGHDLALLGHQAEIFEAAPVAGGMLRLGVPEYRLPRDILAAEVRVIEDLGVRIHLNTKIGKDLEFEHLLEDFDMVFIGAGCIKPRLIDIPGVELDGVLTAVDFLLNVNLGYRVSLGEHVVVVGGGNVAFDVARTATRIAEPGDEDGSEQVAFDVARMAMRAGARRVTIVALENEEELPADREELEEAGHEGIGILLRRGPEAIVGKNGRVRALRTVDVERVFDEQGRFSPKFTPNSSREVECDNVILAVGQAADLDFLGEEHGVELSPRGFVAVDPETLETSRDGVYAGGDIAFGPRIAIQAIADGRRAALAIHRRLQSCPPVAESYTVQSFDKMAYRPAGGCNPDYDTTPRQVPPMLPTGRRVGQTEVEQVYPLDIALCEASRCLRCWVAPVFHSDRCILCGGCADVCPEMCLKLVPLSSLKGDEAFDGLLDAIDAEAGTYRSAIIKDEDVCTRCGLCALRCPADAISMEAVEARRNTLT